MGPDPHYVGTEQPTPTQQFGQDNPLPPSTLASLNKGTVALGQDDHIDVYGDVRMLEDSNGRLCTWELSIEPSITVDSNLKL